MLVLGLRKGEELRVGEMTVKVLGYRSGQMRLGITAPEGVQVERASSSEQQHDIGSNESIHAERSA